WADCRAAVATIAHKKAHGGLDALQVSAINDAAAAAPRRDQTRLRQHREMSRHGVRWYLQPPRNRAGCQALRFVAHQQPKRSEAGLLGKRGEASDGFLCFHISKFMEITIVPQETMRRSNACCQRTRLQDALLQTTATC